MNKNREKELLREVDRLAFVASAIIIFLLGLAYFGLETSGIIGVARAFLQGIILNLIPVFIIFAVSYALLRRIQSIKSEHEAEELAHRIVEEIRGLSYHEPAIAPTSQGSLIQNRETKVVYLVDSNGLKRPINDNDTVLYLAEMLGYQLNKIPQIESALIDPVGQIGRAHV